MGKSRTFHLADQSLRATRGTLISAGAAIRSASAFRTVALNSWRNICHLASMPTWKSARWAGSASVTAQ